MSKAAGVRGIEVFWLTSIQVPACRPGGRDCGAVGGVWLGIGYAVAVLPAKLILLMLAWRLRAEVHALNDDHGFCGVRKFFAYRRLS